MAPSRYLERKGDLDPGEPKSFASASFVRTSKAMCNKARLVTRRRNATCTHQPAMANARPPCEAKCEWHGCWVDFRSSPGGDTLLTCGPACGCAGAKPYFDRGSSWALRKAGLGSSRAPAVGAWGGAVAGSAKICIPGGTEQCCNLNTFQSLQVPSFLARCALKSTSTGFSLLFAAAAMIIAAISSSLSLSLSLPVVHVATAIDVAV